MYKCQLYAIGILSFACSESEDAGKTELARISQPAVVGVGELAVNEAGTYLFWHPGSKDSEKRGELDQNEVEIVQRVTSAGSEDTIGDCSSPDFAHCRDEQVGYVMNARGMGTMCFVASDVEASCRVSEPFLAFRTLLHTISQRHAE